MQYTQKNTFLYILMFIRKFNNILIINKEHMARNENCFFNDLVAVGHLNANNIWFLGDSFGSKTATIFADEHPKNIFTILFVF